LSDALRVNQTLTVLDLDGIGLDDEKIEVLAEGITQNRGITELFFLSNRSISTSAKDMMIRLMMDKTGLKVAAW